MELIKVENGMALASEQLVNEIIEIKKIEDKLKAKKDALSTYLLEEMENKDIKSIETPEILVSYIAETERETLDTKKVREEYPDVYDECVKFSKIKANVRMKVK